MSRVIADLAAIDGAVVLDKRFALVGFGAEVSAEIPAPPRVWRALDTEGQRARAQRHRGRGHAPPRRVSLRAAITRAASPSSISHDGGVSFVANREREVVFWQQSVSP